MAYVKIIVVEVSGIVSKPQFQFFMIKLVGVRVYMQNFGSGMKINFGGLRNTFLLGQLYLKDEVNGHLFTFFCLKDIYSLFFV